MKKKLLILLFSLIIIVNMSFMIFAEEDLVNNRSLSIGNNSDSYTLLSSELQLYLPDIDSERTDYPEQDRLMNLITLYGRGDDLFVPNRNDNLLFDPKANIYEIEIDRLENEKILMLNPLPGVSLEAGFNVLEEDNLYEEDSNIKLQYWPNNRTLLRAEYGFESREWWDIREISLEDNFENNNKTELILNEERNENSSLGIAYQGNERLTLSADYINDLSSYETDYSALFAIEYRDEAGRIRYINQQDFGDIRAHINSIELGYRDLATFNASYKRLSPNQLQESIWDFGLDLSISDISNLSLGYQLRDGALSDIDLNEEEETESNIQARLEFRF